MSRKVKIGVVALSIFVLSYVTLGYVMGQTTRDNAYKALGLYSEVLQRIQQDYVEEPNIPLVTAGAMHGLLESLDPLSGYLTAQEYAEYKKRLAEKVRGEAGAVLSKRFGYIAVVSVLPDSPAFKAGLRSGDLLETIGGFSTREMSVAEAQTLLTGEPGTGIALTVISRRVGGGGQSEAMDLVRREVAYPPVMTEQFENEVGYLRVAALNAGKSGEIRQRLAELEKKGARRLVLDLRDCAAGDMKEAIETAKLFAPSGTLVTLRGQTVTEQRFSAESGNVAWKHSVVVLISNGTAGPGEIVAAALGGKPNGTGTVQLVGERTFGSASEQKLIPLEDGAALILTVAYYYTPDGKSIPENGVEPTVEVSAPDGSESEAESGDRMLTRAIEVLLNPASAEKKGQARLRPRHNFDLAA